MGWICQKIKLPALLGMLITGVILGTYGLNLLDGSILGNTAESKNSIDHYSYKSRSWTGSVRTEKKLEDLQFLCVLYRHLLNCWV